jgi:choline dehydrogenase-like flavoprotein
MRSLRFELTPAAQRRESAPSAFGHISFESKIASGFDALREFLRALQRSGRFDRQSAMRVVSDLPYISKAAIWRFLYKQLYWPTPANYALHVVAEQLPRHVNRISLASEKDLLGLPLAAVDWHVSSDDTRIFSIYRRNFERFWAKYGLNAIGDLEWRISSDPDAETIPLSGDVYHPGGSTRMGSDSRSAVVNNNLKTFSVQNLWISSTSVFPSGASANPTLMLMLFTQRLADHLAKSR